MGMAGMAENPMDFDDVFHWRFFGESPQPQLPAISM